MLPASLRTQRTKLEWKVSERGGVAQATTVTCWVKSYGTLKNRRSRRFDWGAATVFASHGHFIF